MHVKVRFNDQKLFYFYSKWFGVRVDDSWWKVSTKWALFIAGRNVRICFNSFANSGFVFLESNHSHGSEALVASLAQTLGR